MQMSRLRKEMESIDEKLALRKKMLDDADDELDDVESDDDATCDV